MYSLGNIEGKNSVITVIASLASIPRQLDIWVPDTGDTRD